MRKSRFILEYENLEKIRDSIESHCKEAITKLESVIEKFQRLPQRITEFQQTWKEILATRARERELIRVINEDRQQPSRLDYLEQEAQKIRNKTAKVEEIEKECRVLTSKIKKLPSIEEKKQKLINQLNEYEDAIKTISEKGREISRNEEVVTKREAVLSNRIASLQKRSDWLELAILDEAIESAKNKLSSLSKQLCEKRSLLDKVLDRNKERG